MNLDQIKSHLGAYKQHNQIEDATNFLIRSFGLEEDGFSGFLFREDFKPNYIALTTEGEFGEPQKMRIPPNILDFDLNLVINMIAHEMIHIRQKTIPPFVEDKNEREWQAHYEMLFHKIFPQIPVMSDFFLKTFSEKALEYYKRMGDGSVLQQKYAVQKTEVEKLLDEILIRRGEKVQTLMPENKMQKKPEISWSDFEKVDIRTGTILSVNNFPEVRNPAYKLEIDFGELGVLKSSAQITALYKKEELVGKQILAVVNFPKKQIATFMSECLVLGVYGEDKSEVNVLTTSLPAKNGLQVG